MRGLSNEDTLRRLMDALGGEAGGPVSAYFTEGATAVLIGWRPTTVDVDIRFEPHDDSVLRAITRLKELLRVNVELTSPADFIPVPAGWEGRSTFIEIRGSVSYYHFDMYAQALAKVERGHKQDIEDVTQMQERGLIEDSAALDYFRSIEPDLYRYPALDPREFRESVRARFGT